MRWKVFQEKHLEATFKWILKSCRCGYEHEEKIMERFLKYEEEEMQL